tara:strand:+ start:150 stop:659 length:510 start_codon:yes stop_codon:yes gene_type:complete
MRNILIIGCGLIGSSILRAINKKKIAKKIFVYEKSKKNILKIRKLRLACTITDDLKNIIPKLDLIILCTPMSEYEKIILKINKYLIPKTIITDVGSSKEISLALVKKKLKKGISWTSSHPIAGSEVSGPEFGDKNLFLNKWCILIKEQNSNKKHLIFLSKFWRKIALKL